MRWAPSDEFLRLIPRDFARVHHILSRGRSAAGRELLVVAPSTQPAAVLNVRARLGVAVTTETCGPESIASEIDRAYASYAEQRGHATTDVDSGADSAAPSGEIERLLADADRDLLSTDGKGPVVKLVDAMLFEALSRHSSDIHVQPLADRTLVRYRIDGVLRTTRELPTRVTPAVVSRIKVMGRMDIAERRVPQDGRATVTIGRSDRERHGGTPGTERVQDAQDALDGSPGGPGGRGGRSVDLRISTLPTSYGERAVIRLLDNSRGRHLGDFESLGMPDVVRSAFLERATRSSGIVLVTGPTGSGKTTTLYATLSHIAAGHADGTPLGGVAGGGRRDFRDCGFNLMTIEDPIEYELSTVGLAISQAQVNSKKGVTFATGLRHILRQDPDVIMVGEIRDAETARIAIQASLTGHLVFSTLHTSDAATAVTRLVDLGVEPYLVSASLSAVLAQRLVRRVHAGCRGAGCHSAAGAGGGEAVEGCFGTGYQGRIGLFELLTVAEGVRELISRGGTASQIRSAARVGGMRTLVEEGRRLIAEGLTTEAEVLRVVHGTGDDDEPLAGEGAAPDAGTQAAISTPGGFSGHARSPTSGVDE